MSEALPCMMCFARIRLLAFRQALIAFVAELEVFKHGTRSGGLPPFALDQELLDLPPHLLQPENLRVESLEFAVGEEAHIAAEFRRTGIAREQPFAIAE